MDWFKYELPKGDMRTITKHFLWDSVNAKLTVHMFTAWPGKSVRVQTFSSPIFQTGEREARRNVRPVGEPQWFGVDFLREAVRACNNRRDTVVERMI